MNWYLLCSEIDRFSCILHNSPNILDYSLPRSIRDQCLYNSIPIESNQRSLISAVESRRRKEDIRQASLSPTYQTKSSGLFVNDQRTLKPTVCPPRSETEAFDRCNHLNVRDGVVSACGRKGQFASIVHFAANGESPQAGGTGRSREARPVGIGWFVKARLRTGDIRGGSRFWRRRRDIHISLRVNEKIHLLNRV